MPSIRQLEYLVAIADTRHFRRAADLAGISQPTLSAQLAALEERLGLQLVERSRSGVVLTAAGEQIETIARRMLADLREIRDIAASHREAMGGVIRLGLPHSIGPYLLPSVVPDLHQRFPSLRLYVREGLPAELPDALERGGHDVLIVPIPIRGETITSLPLFREPLHLAVPADHRLARQQRISRRDLKDQPILALERGHQLRSVVEDIARDNGARLLTNFEGTSLDTLRQMVESGIGLTFLPGLYVQRALGPQPGIRIVALDGRPITRTIGLAWRQTSQRAGDFRSLAEVIREAIRRDFPGTMRLGEEGEQADAEPDRKNRSKPSEEAI